jgi:hypothetical protein
MLPKSPECSKANKLYILKRRVFNLLHLAIHQSFFQNNHRRITVKTNPPSMKFVFTITYIFLIRICIGGRSQWSHGIRHEPSSPAQHWIACSNPIRGMDACFNLFCICVVLCVGSDLVTGSSPSKESCRLCIGIRNWKIG